TPKELADWHLRFTAEDGEFRADDELTVTVVRTVMDPPVLAVVAGEPALLRFNAEAGVSYTVRAQDTLDGGWSRVLDVPALAVARTIEVPLTATGGTRFFQVITTAQP
ncbi:MAG: hypothetical protein ACO3I0_10500, partial [Limisphaerales bacterium]